MNAAVRIELGLPVCVNLKGVHRGTSDPNENVEGSGQTVAEEVATKRTNRRGSIFLQTEMSEEIFGSQ